MEDNAKNEILEAISEFSTHVDGRFSKIESRLEGVESKMVTKDDLDSKLGKLNYSLKVYIDEKMGEL